MDLSASDRSWLSAATLLALVTSCSSNSRSNTEATTNAGSGTTISGSGGVVTAGASGSTPTPPPITQPPTAGNNAQPTPNTAGSNATPTAGAAANGGRAGSPAGNTAGAPATPPPPPSTAGSGAAGSGTAAPPSAKFSFFVTSIEAIREWSKNENGFGGNLSYGQPTGLAGADKICTEIAEKALPGSGAKTWRAFLSAAKGGEGGGPVHAKDRIGKGPWYDRRERIIAMDLTALLQVRPMGADPMIANNLPNERGEPNQADRAIDNHDMLTGSNAKGELDTASSTCNDWTSADAPAAQPGGQPGQMMGPRIGHAWPAGSGMGWMSAHQVPSCAPSVSLRQGGGGPTGVGSLGGYGGFYCFALTP